MVRAVGYGRLAESECAVSCHQCGQIFEPKDLAGEWFECPACHTKIRAERFRSSLWNQLKAIEKFFVAQVHDAAELEFQWEVCPSSVPFFDRPTARQLVNSLHTGDHLILSHLDRGWMKLDDFAATCEAFFSNNVRVQILDQPFLTDATQAGRDSMELIRRFGEMKRALENSRIADAFRRKQRNPSTYNGVEYGWELRCAKCNKLLPPKGKNCPQCGVSRARNSLRLPNACEREVMVRIHRWREDGVPWDGVINLLKIGGYITKQGKPWAEMSVKASLRLCHRLFRAAREMDRQNIIDLKSEIHQQRMADDLRGLAYSGVKQPGPITRPVAREY